MAVPQVCGVTFESFPAWIWAFRLSDWEGIYLTDSDELRLRQYHGETWAFLENRMRIISKHQVAATRGIVGIWFVSGSLEFIHQFTGPDDTPVMSWLEGCGRRRPQNTTSQSWFSVSHENVGGSTTARGVFGRSGLNGLSVPVDVLRRSISHIMKYSIRPEPCELPFQSAHYGVNQRLSMHHISHPVVYETRFSRTGWGSRCLENSELAQAFDLPPYLEWNACFPTVIVPIQVFRAVVDAVLERIRPEDQEHEAIRKKRHQHSSVTPSNPLELDAVWLAPLNRWLPGSWADVEISDRAVKSDDARVEQFTWNQRILLVIPAATPRSIQVIEEFCLRRWRWTVRMSFFAYLERTYGVNWRRRFRSTRRQRGVGGSHLPGAKRRRLLGSDFAMEPHDDGGETISSALVNKSASQLVQDVRCGLRVLNQVLRSSWWEWTFGSGLFFWRWNGQEQMKAARDGIPIFVADQLPTKRRQKPARLQADQQALVAEKLEGMVSRDYLEVGHVASTVHFFSVPKGESDIRVVFDGTSSGLNETLWSPNFFLPSAKSAAMCMSFSSWMADMDFGEMFHNFHMDPKIRPYSGVDLGNMSSMVSNVPAAKGHSVLLRWTRLFMGMRPSPYNAVRHYYWGEEFARGNPSKPDNPMGYDCVKLNLPGMTDYDPSYPKVMKWKTGKSDSDRGHVAGDVVTFVDDVRVTGYSKGNCWEVYRQFASRIQFLGMQNAPRKFRPPSQSNAGAWTGTIFKIGTDQITKSVSQEKWDKGRRMVAQLLETVTTTEDKDFRPALDRRELEKETGFLNHLSMTFETMVPYLKGFYLTLNSWREGRDDDDWKVSSNRWKAILFARSANGRLSEEEVDLELSKSDEVDAPKSVRASPSLKGDLEALSYLFGPTGVPEVRIRSKAILTIVYGFGDASGTGLGATFTCEGGFNFRIGVWGSAENPESSNWKEFTNIVESLEDEARSGNLADSEVYMFTDNSTVESCAARGSSSSPKLLRLVIRLHGLMTRSGVKIHIFHVAGTRMIAQGTDGVSRGYLGQGVMAGESMVAYIPVHVSAVERSPIDLVPWIRSWSGKDTRLLEPEGWFESGHDIEGWRRDEDGFERPILSEGRRRSYIWSPPPLAAEVAIAELRKARIKRQDSCHIFVCPRLCTTQWAKQLYRTADIVFELPVGFSCWPTEMHEPLLIGILFPFLRVKPWQIKGTPKMFAVGRQLRGLLQESEMESGNILRKLWSLCGDLPSMPEHMVRQLLFLR